ncbi:MAG: polyprenyl synthetase family protein [Deltaproteobacteria bacterium]|nr:polyprenyl synthetase family protein [Deltaproteobacteria bacterium]
MTQNFSLKSYLTEGKKLIEDYLNKCLPAPQTWPETLHQSMHYSLMAGGKRLRPILCLASTECLGGNQEEALAAAAALEMIHTYSLIHDDLPAMDDDDLRRGRPTNHKVYGEAMAILAGDALLTEAFRLLSLSHYPQDPLSRLQLIQIIAEASGSQGMVGGQAIDLLSEGKKITLEALEKIHQNKTGKLILASVQAGALIAGAQGEDWKRLSRFAQNIGLSFQIADDILDIEGGEDIGKDLGSDLEKNKATYPALLGLEASKKRAKALMEEALDCLSIYGEKGQALKAIAEYVVSRKN